jgi:hypothetical protein
MGEQDVEKQALTSHDIINFLIKLFSEKIVFGTVTARKTKSLRGEL